MRTHFLTNRTTQKLAKGQIVIVRGLGTSISETVWLLGSSCSAVFIYAKWINKDEDRSRLVSVGRHRVIKDKGRRKLFRFELLVLVEATIEICKLSERNWGLLPPLYGIFLAGKGIFQQDNAPCQKAEIVLELFEKQKDEPNQYPGYLIEASASHHESYPMRPIWVFIKKSIAQRSCGISRL
ncbi:DDE_3 domain-containing protein [Trichonephila clavipes]|nr:DDE_3 domain-containing protein [Trichonephila clavipes]